MLSSSDFPVMSRTLTDVVREFEGKYKRKPSYVVQAPGRVNLLGAHIDYHEGWVLPAAIDLSVWLAVAPSFDDVVELTALNLDASSRLHLRALREPVSNRTNPQTTWIDLPGGVAWALQELSRETRRDHEPKGMLAVYGSDVPMGAGVSSSAAVEMAFLLAWETLGKFTLSGAERALLGRRVENEYLGVASGVMDQYACLHGERNHLVFLDCRTLEHDLVPLPDNLSFLVVDSGVERRLADSGFNDRRAQGMEALEILRKKLPKLKTLRDLDAETFVRHADRLPETLRKRVRHVVEECARVHGGVAALGRGDIDGFGALVRSSHASSRDNYEVSLPELDLIAETAWDVPGVYGARLAGGGFGGCVIALCHESSLEEAEGRIADAFEAKFGRRPGMFRCRPSVGAQVHEIG